MNHLQEAKKLDEYSRTQPIEPEEESNIRNWISSHALIAIAERQDNNFKSQVRIEKHLSKIAEQLEKNNKIMELAFLREEGMSIEEYQNYGKQEDK